MTDKTGIDAAACLALAERLEGGESGPEIESLVWQALFPGQEVMTDPGDVRERRPAAYGPLGSVDISWPTSESDWEAMRLHVGAEKVSRSLDATEALRERLLPALGFLIGKGFVSRDEPLFGAIISALGDPNDEVATGEHPTELAGAFLVAILRAVAAQAEDEREPFGRDQGKEIIG